MISRLRESKTKYDQAEFEQGKKRGALWAERTASWEELERLSGHSWDDLSRGESVEDWSPTIACAINPEADSQDIADYREFCGEAAMSEEFAHGFYEGATDVFSEVRQKV
jgi:hypothetical protein